MADHPKTMSADAPEFVPDFDMTTSDAAEFARSSDDAALAAITSMDQACELDDDIADAVATTLKTTEVGHLLALLPSPDAKASVAAQLYELARWLDWVAQQEKDAEGEQDAFATSMWAPPGDDKAAAAGASKTSWEYADIAVAAPASAPAPAAEPAPAPASAPAPAASARMAGAALADEDCVV